jgi:hypothetical protein
MNDWTDGYRAALRDIDQLVRARFLITGDGWDDLIRDMLQDVLDIEREHLMPPKMSPKLVSGGE